tara:strand:+ start:1186 stop:1395 length:210 start_codon:yes stop_codon:yes gene_type:complete
MNSWKGWDKQYRARFIAKRNSCTIGEQLVDCDEERKEKEEDRDNKAWQLKLAQQGRWIDIEFDSDFSLP